MSSWAIVALVAIVIWGIVESIRARAGIITDEDGNQKVVAREDGGGPLGLLQEIKRLQARLLRPAAPIGQVMGQAAVAPIRRHGG